MTKETNMDFEVRSLDILSGVKSALSGDKPTPDSPWWRIQEMFRLQSFHMYGVTGSAVVTGIISVWLIKKSNIKTLSGQPIQFHPKQFNKGQIYGGLLFGFGWAITGACPGPLFAQIGAGFTVVTVTLLSAITGTWIYGYLREKLPH